jgi:hypothetical protein
MLQLSAINAPHPGMITVSHFDHFEDTILPAITDLDPRTGLPWFLDTSQFYYSSRRHLFEWIGGGPIAVYSARYPDAIKGPQRAFAVMDEPGIIAYEAYRATVNRIRHPMAKLRQFVASGTPEGLTWLADLVERERTGGDRPVFVYRMHTRDNRELLTHQPTYIQQVLENATEAEARSYLAGDVVTLVGAAAYPSFARDVHWRTDVPVLPDLPLRISFDFNVDPMACIVAQIVPGDDGRMLHVIDAVVQHASWTPEVCHVLVARYGREACRTAGLGDRGWPGGLIVYGDATGRARTTVSLQSNYDLIREILAPESPAGFAIHPSVLAGNPAQDDRVNAVNVLLRDATGRVRCLIRKTLPVETCSTRPLVRSLEQTIKAPGTNQIWKGGHDTITHASDALGYLVAAEFPVVKPQILTPTTLFASTDW